MKTIGHLAAALLVLMLDWIIGASRTEPVPHGPLLRFVAKHPWMTAAAVVTVLGLGAATVLVSGIVPIRASSGHWFITAALLDFAKVQSVNTYSLGITPPPLDDEALVLRGAAHYAIGCEPCHGSPASPVPAVMAAMTPAPPALVGEQLTRWTPAELFSIVKHGIKFTGMPAWPVQQRDDDVWGVVAFLERLPTLDAAEYRRLAGQEPVLEELVTAVATTGRIETPERVRILCSRCHGIDGRGRADAFPSLAGQHAAYLEASLRAFADEARYHGTMAEIASRLDDRQMREVASYYEQLPARRGAPAPESPSVARGSIVATQGIVDRDIPACVECHGPSDLPKNPAYPRLAGQHAWYLARQLELLKERRRGGTPRLNLMHAVVDRLQPRDIEDVAQYYASLTPDGG